MQHAPAPTDFVQHLKANDLAELEALGRRERFARNDFVFSAGGPGRTVYFLRSGRVKIFQPSAPGREVILWFCLPGEIFGLAEVARGGGRSVSAVACEPCEVLCVAQEQFMAFVEERPRVAMLSMQVLSSRLRVLGEMHANLVSDDVDTRVAKLILRLAARHGARRGTELVLALPLTHQEIADMVGTTRQTVTSCLGNLKRRGVLSIDSHRLVIESEELLASLAA
jgi:CRP/FNR family cyclic AMP-dependent transcriptional regulator